MRLLSNSAIGRVGLGSCLGNTAGPQPEQRLMNRFVVQDLGISHGDLVQMQHRKAGYT